MREDREFVDLIYEVLDSINLQLPQELQLAKQPDTVLIGPGGTLDSLGIITLLVAIEEAVAERFTAQIMLLSDTNGLASLGSVTTIAMMASHIGSKLKEAVG